MKNSRKLKLNKNYLPCVANENDEIYPNGIFRFNVTRILEQIGAGKLEAEKAEINTVEWFRTHFRGSVNESHLPSVDVTLPVLQAEIRQGMYEIIDGHHRLEKAYRNDIKTSGRSCQLLLGHRNFLVALVIKKCTK